MKTHKEWIAYFRSIEMDNGSIWHFIDGLYALGLIKPEPKTPHAILTSQTTPSSL